jgi:hypothetical protein
MRPNKFSIDQIVKNHLKISEQTGGKSAYTSTAYSAQYCRRFNIPGASLSRKADSELLETIKDIYDTSQVSQKWSALQQSLS